MNTAIVLGVGRCGSSMVAGILHHLGIYMGKLFVEADDYNKSGYWEDITIMGLQNRLLSLSGRSWWDPFRSDTEFAMNMFASPKMQKVHDKLMETFDKRIAQAQSDARAAWGFKDPRTYMFINSYIHKLPNPHIIYVHRDPLAIARSVLKRDPGKVIDLDGALNLVNTHINGIATVGAKLSERPHIHVNYRDILDAPDEHVKILDEFTGGRAGLRGRAEAEAFIDPYLRTW